MISLLVLAASLLAGAIVTRLPFLFLGSYLVIALLVLSRFWVWRMRKGLRVHRSFAPRLFVGETTTVTIHLTNQGILPIPWLNVREGIPLRLASYDAVRHVASLRPRGSAVMTYELPATRRGFHRLGPMSVRYGDVFGISTEELLIDTPEFLIVYPEIAPISAFRMPSSTPFGEMRSNQRIYEDPLRVIGVRDYQSGDSQRLINWKATASAGRLLVRKLEPAVSHEVQLFVDLSLSSYSREWRESAPETSIVVAASVATYLINNRQSVGLAVNGADPLVLGGHRVVQHAEAVRRMAKRYPRLSIGRGRAHLMSILELLARVQVLEGEGAADMVTAGSVGLPWGSTLILITGLRSRGLLDSLVGQRKLGHRVIVVFTDPSAANLGTAAARAAGLTAMAITGKDKMSAWGDHRAAV